MSPCELRSQALCRGDDEVHLGVHQLGGKCGQAIEFSVREPKLERNLCIRPAQFPKCLP